MHQLSRTYKKMFSKPVLVSVVFVLLFLAISSQVFAQSTGAGFRCVLGGPLGGTSGRCWDTQTNCQINCGGGSCVPVNDCTNPEGGGAVGVASAIVDKGLNLLSPLYWLTKIVEFINVMLVWVVGIAAKVLDIAIDTSLAGLSGIPAIQKGWEIARDLTNIFFIFILLVIAIATILRLEAYGAKQLLAKVVVVALLVNFSLVIAFTVVDASNILALTFIKRIHPVSHQIAKVLDINKINRIEKSARAGTQVGFVDALSAGWYAMLNRYNQNVPGLPPNLAPAAVGVTLNDSNSNAVQLFYQVIILILELTLIFVFIAMGGLLLIRSVALIIIFILAPFGFLAAILPATRGYSKEWWDKLFQWSFFFPAMAFFVYIAIYYGAAIKTLNLQGSQALNTALLFNYFVVVALLIGSLLVARRLGIMGAGFFIGMGLGLARRARGYAGRTTRAGVYATGRATAIASGPGAGRVAGELGTHGAVGRFFAKPFARLQAAGEKAVKGREKVFEDAIKQSDTTFQARYAAAVTPQERRAARRAAVEQGKANLISTQDRQVEYQRATREHDNKALRNIEAVDPRIAATALGLTGTAAQDAINASVARLSPKAFEEKISADALHDEMVQNAILIGAGEKQLEAGVQRFGADFTNAIQQAYTRLSGRMGTPDATFNELYENNRDVLKTINQNPAFAAALPGVRTEIRDVVRQRNEQTADDAANTARAAVLGAGGTAAEAEAAAQSARRSARRIEI